MDGNELSKQDRHDRLAQTLGDVLYADKAQSTVSEGEWGGLVRSIAAGDQRALHALYERTHRIVFTLIMRITSNRETAEEITLDVFHDVWRRSSTYDPVNGTVIGWIMNQARSRAIDRLRFDQRKKRVDQRPDSSIPEEAVAGPYDTLQLREQGRLLKDALTLLTPREREAIEMAFFAGLTHVEVAARLNEPLGTVKTRIRSGMAKLRHALAGKL